MGTRTMSGTGWVVSRETWELRGGRASRGESGDGSLVVKCGSTPNPPHPLSPSVPPCRCRDGPHRFIHISSSRTSSPMRVCRGGGGCSPRALLRAAGRQQVQPVCLPLQRLCLPQGTAAWWPLVRACALAWSIRCLSAVARWMCARLRGRERMGPHLPGCGRYRCGRVATPCSLVVLCSCLPGEHYLPCCPGVHYPPC
jgi:hypothetical protein